MPWGDGTGPWWARGRGWRCWRSAGWNRMSGAPGFLGPTPVNQVSEKESITQEIQALENRLEELKKRLSQLE